MGSPQYRQVVNTLHLSLHYSGGEDEYLDKTSTLTEVNITVFMFAEPSDSDSAQYLGDQK